MFRNAQIYRLDGFQAMTAEALNDALKKARFQPCGATEAATAGFVPPQQNGDLAHVVGRDILICLQVETRILPSSVIADEAGKRADQIEKEMGYRPGRKQMAEIKESVTTELLPKAFTRRKKEFAWIDRDGGFITVDAVSRNAADQILSKLREVLEEFPLRLLDVAVRPLSAMTDWVMNDAPEGFTIDKDCELESRADDDSKIRYVHHSLDGEEIEKHIASGKFVSKLAMTLGDRVSFVLNDRLEIKGVKLLDIVTESAESGDPKTDEEQFDADFALAAGEIRLLRAALINALGGLEECIDPSFHAEDECTEDDPLYQQAVEIVKSNGRASISLVQRLLRIGYNRAAALIEAMEERGIVSPMDAPGHRKVLVGGC
jgi:recombination associated protein RdgC